MTIHNYFTYVPLANDLYINHKNKWEIPSQLLETKERPIYNSVCIWFDNNHSMMTSYILKRNKTFNFHIDDSIDPKSFQLKPEVITFYNSMKGGVDVAN